MATGTKNAKKEGAKDKKKKSPFRQTVECVVLAVGLALLVRYFVIEPFTIPTTSMEPTLIGNPNYGDKIIAAKWAYKYGADGPARWDVVVFRHVKNGRALNYIKRIVGLPGERIVIRHGDLYLRDPHTDKTAIIRKPEELQDALWLTFHEGDFGRPLGDLPWTESPGTGFWRTDGGKLVYAGGRKASLQYTKPVTNLYVRQSLAEFEAGGAAHRTVIDTAHPRPVDPATGRTVDTFTTLLQCTTNKNCLRVFKHEVTSIPYPAPDLESVESACCPFCGAQIKFGSIAKHILVGDLKCDVEVVAAGPATLFLTLEEDGTAYELALPLAKPGTMVLKAGETVLLEEEVSIPAGTHRLRFMNADDVLRAELASGDSFERLFRKEISCPVTVDTTFSNSAALGAEGAPLEVTRLALARDLYYIATGRDDTNVSAEDVRARELRGFDGFGTIPSDSYIALGDNSAASADSRYWENPFIARDDIMGRALFIWWPPSRIRRIR